MSKVSRPASTRAKRPVRVNLGIALEEAGDLEGATNAYKEVLDLDPKWRSRSELCTYGDRSR